MASDPKLTQTAEREGGSDKAASRRWLFISGIPLVYVVTLLLTRLLTSLSLEHDEAEQVLFAQRLEWGYSLQPPLYTWLVWLSFQVFGLTRFALAVVKAALLLGMFTVMARLLRRLDVPRHATAAAAMTVLFSPFFAWNVSLNITHTVLSTTIFAATLLHAAALLERTPRTRDYLVLGVLSALGVLAKYNFVLFAGALFLAGLTLPAARRVLVNARMLLAAAAGLLILAPHLVWLFTHWDGVFAALRTKTALDEASLGPARIGHGLWTLVGHAAVLLVPVLAVTSLCLGRRMADVWSRASDRLTLRLLERTALTLAVLMVLLVGTAINRMTAGWLAPGLLLAPLIVFGRLAAAGWPDRLGTRLGWAVGLVVIGTTAIRIGLYGGWHGRNRGRDLLFAQAARVIEHADLSTRPFLTDNLLTAGNLRFHCPRLRVASLDMPLFRLDATDTAEVFAWNSSKKPVRSVCDHLTALGVADAAADQHLRHIILQSRDLHPGFRSLAIFVGDVGGPLVVTDQRNAPAF